MEKEKLLHIAQTCATIICISFARSSKAGILPKVTTVDNKTSLKQGK